MNRNPDPPPTDLMPIHFGPCVCGRWPGLPQSEGWAVLAGWDDGAVEWVDGPADLTTPTHFAPHMAPHSPIRRRRPPVPGERVPVRLSYPFQGELGRPFWCHVPGALAVYNGYESEADLAEARIVRAALVAVSETEEPGNGGPARRAIAEVAEALTFDDLLDLPPRDGPLAVIDAARSGESQTERFCGWRWSSIGSCGDVDAWALWREIDGVGHLLLTAAWEPHVTAFQGGHRLLGSDEIAYLAR